MTWPIFHPFLHPLSWVLGKVCFHSTSHSSRSCLPDPAQQLSQKQHLVGFQACLFFLPPEFSLPLCVILLFPHLTSSCVLVLCAVADTPQRKMFFSENLLAFHRVWNAVVNGFVVGLLDACFSCVWERKTCMCVCVSLLFHLHYSLTRWPCLCLWVLCHRLILLLFSAAFGASWILIVMQPLRDGSP